MPDARLSRLAVKLGYRPALDGVRAIAIGLVVSMHAFGWPGNGALGVDLFFVLSGFLITSLLLQEHVETGRVSLPGFYRRRALRLLPALFVMLAAYGTAELTQGRSPFLPIALSVGYVANVAEAAGSHALQPSLGHIWSLAEEEQFYLLWPTLLLVGLRFRARIVPRILVGLVLVVMIEKFVLIISGTPLDPRIYRGPDTHADPLLVGCIAAFLFAKTSSQFLARRNALVGYGALVTVIGSTIFVGRIGASGRLFTLLYAIPFMTGFALACGLLIMCAAQGSPPSLARLLSARPLLFVGRISYSIYLWHIPVLAALNGAPRSRPPLGEHDPALAVVAILLTVMLATASYFLIERPFLRLKYRRRDAAYVTGTPAPVPAVSS